MLRAVALSVAMMLLGAATAWTVSDVTWRTAEGEVTERIPAGASQVRKDSDRPSSVVLDTVAQMFGTLNDTAMLRVRIKNSDSVLTIPVGEHAWNLCAVGDQWPDCAKD